MTGTNYNLLQGIIDAPNIGLAVYKAVRDESGNIIDFVHEFINKKTRETLGQDFTGRLLSDHGPDGIKQIDLMKKVVETQTSNTYVLEAGSGVVKGWFRFSNAPLGGDRVLHMWEDFSEQKKAEQQIKDQAHYLKAIADTNPDMISVINLETRALEFANASAFIAQGFGSVTDAFEQRDSTARKNAVHADYLQSTENYFKAFRHMSDDDVQKLEYRATNDKGEVNWYFAQGKVFRRNEDGVPTHAISIVHNITESKKAELEILRLKDEIAQRATDKYYTLFNSIDEGFCLIKMLHNEQGDPVDWIYLEANPTFQQQVGFDPVGKRVSEAVGNIEPFWFNFFNQVLQTRIPARTENIVASIGRWYNIHASPIEGSNDLVAVVFDDITERKQGEIELRESEQRLTVLLKQRDEFISIASHELKTPVTSMKVYAELVQARLEELGNDSDSLLLAKLNKQIDRLTVLINNLLDTTKISEGQLRFSFDTVNIDELVEERIETIKNTSDHKLIFKAGGTSPITADRERIGQVITNLLSNAIKYSPRDSTVTVTTKNTATHIEVSVEDRGLGIPAKDRQKVFDRFFRVPSDKMDTFPGMGLGLYISAQIIQRHGGNISAQSEEGKGSVFTFTLPFNGDGATQ